MIKNWILGGLAALALCGAARAQDVTPAPGCQVGITCFAGKLGVGGALPGANAFAVTGVSNFNGTVTISAAGSLSSVGPGIRLTSDTGEFSLGALTDVHIVRDAANALAMRNGASPQNFNLYNTYTDGSNYEGAYVKWSGNVFRVGPFALGTGTQRALSLETSGTSRWQIDVSGNLIGATDGTYNIGAVAANRPNNIFASGTMFSLYFKNTPATVAGLASPTSQAGLKSFVTDSSVAASGNFGAIVAGGGANGVPVYSDGTNWRIG